MAYVSAFRLLADAVHSSPRVPRWSGLPIMGAVTRFPGAPTRPRPDEPGFALLDTSGDGVLSMADDPYLPYYPGDDAVDWVGMSLYHWGSAWPWGENEIPEPGKFIAQLTGTYSGLGGDDSAIPDFYQVYSVQHGKPVAITETAALYNTGASGDDELSIKQAWWRQVFDRDTLIAYPGIQMINWFERIKPESEVGNASRGLAGARLGCHRRPVQGRPAGRPADVSQAGSPDRRPGWGQGFTGREEIAVEQ